MRVFGRSMLPSQNLLNPLAISDANVSNTTFYVISVPSVVIHPKLSLRGENIFTVRLEAPICCYAHCPSSTMSAPLGILTWNRASLTPTPLRMAAKRKVVKLPAASRTLTQRMSAEALLTPTRTSL